MKYATSYKNAVMKRFIPLCLVLLAAFTIKGQSTYTDLPGRWRLGGNMGAIWMNSDVTTVPGFGGGFTIEKILNKHVSPIGFSLGFRYLGGKTYGLNTNPTPDSSLKDNNALNGTFDSSMNYVGKGGYFYANHRTSVHEGALELKMNFPRLEQKTRIIFHLWGGVGIANYKTYINALDSKGNLYNFSSLNGKTVTQSDLNHLMDGSYETLAQGSGSGGTWRFTPSCGVGLGVRLSKNVALVFEHKISFPLTDYMDGYAYSGSKCPNDRYHYTGVNLLFTFYGKSHSSSSTHTDNNVYTNNTNTTTNGNTGVVTNNNSNTTTTTTTQTVTEAPKTPPPAVHITYPSNYFNSQYDNVSVSAQLQNINSSQQIGITLNGNPLTHFSFNPSNGILNFQSFLALGNNNFVVTGTNQGGVASDNVTVVYNPQFNSGGNIINGVNTNTVVNTTTVTNTNSNTTTTTTVSPTHTNTVSTNNSGTVSISTPTTSTTNTVSTNTNGNVTIHTNTVSATNTVSPTNTGTVSIHTTTVNPTGTVTATGTVTPTGTVSVHTPTLTPTGTVVATGTTTTAQVGVPPVIQIINPAVSGQEEPGTSYNVSASVLNMDNNSTINITVNGAVITQYTYGRNNKMLNFFAPLQDGKNRVVITATNAYGSDTKSTDIMHHAGKPPKVVISDPSANPYSSLVANVTVKGFVYNVNSSSDITVKVNGNTAPFNYNPGNYSIDVNLQLAEGNTVVMISALNAFGSDMQSVSLKYQKPNSGGGTNMQTMLICHHPEDDPNHPVSMTIPVSDWPAHEAHGDSKGECPVITNSSSGTGGGIGGHGNTGGTHTKPEISVNNPISDPFYTNNSNISGSAMISQVLNASDVTVTRNGAAIASNFDINSKMLSFSSGLQQGMNTFIISASNAFGTSTKAINVNYSPINNNNNNIQQGGGNNNQGGVLPNIIQPKVNNNGNNNGGGNGGTVKPGGIGPISPKKPDNSNPAPNQGRPVNNAQPTNITPAAPSNNGGRPSIKPGGQ